MPGDFFSTTPLINNYDIFKRTDISQSVGPAKIRIDFDEDIFQCVGGIELLNDWLEQWKNLMSIFQQAISYCPHYQ